FVQVFDPQAGPLTGVEYGIDFTDVDVFELTAPNNTPATATDLGRVVDAFVTTTLTPLDQDWFRATMRALDGTLDVLAKVQGDPVVVNVFEDSDNNGAPDNMVATGSGLNIILKNIPAQRDQQFWVQLVLVDSTNLDAAGSLVQLELKNQDRFDDPPGDGVGGMVSNPTGFDPDGPNDGPRIAGTTVEG